jgi:tetratricopeptide repeat protein
MSSDQEKQAMARAFVIRPFGKKKDSAGKEFDFEAIQTQVIGPAVVAAGLEGSTTGEIISAGNIREDMFAFILAADLVICDITLLNSNVFYELGIRHALRRRNTLLIKHEGSADAPPFDVLTDRYLSYDLADRDAKTKLAQSIRATLHSERPTDSPIFSMLSDLPEADPSSGQFVPLDFREEVNRACAGKSKGWLRLLAQDVRGRPFERPGLQLVAEGQWDLKDYAGARENLEAIRAVQHENVKANLALANVYERMYRDEKKPDLLALSDQAIERVLNGRDIPRRDQVEAWTLQGRNQKTRWRLEFADLATVEERRAAGMSEPLRRCLDAYRAAFAKDLNHFWSGLAALQMGTIFLDLSETSDSWKSTFNDDAEADRYRQNLVQDVAALRHVVSASVDTALANYPVNHKDRIWAEVSKVDVLFLTDQNDQRVVNRYRDSIPREKPFVWDAARGQLQLFADLGVRAGRAEKVIAEVDRKFAGAAKPPQKPLHVVLFAGHRIDGPGRSPRFPANRADRAKTLIRNALTKLVSDDLEIFGLASAAPGADILFHEVCEDLQVRSVPCLPMPADKYARHTFGDGVDDWRSRFLALLSRQRERKSDVLELSAEEGLPRWLTGTAVNVWERGNCWVLQMGVAIGAQRTTLLALWDGQPEGDDRGGTAQMVQLAREAGIIDVKVIDSHELL